MNNLYIKIVSAFALSLFGLQAQSTIMIDAESCLYNGDVYNTSGSGYTCWRGTIPKNPKVADFSDITGIDLDLKEVYKDNQGGVEEGTLPGSYDTAYNTDLSGGTVSYIDGKSSVACPACFLLVKDGHKEDPVWYLFDIGYWDGKMDIKMQNFWNGNGSISHIAIWAEGINVPEPGVAGLLSIGLLAMLMARRRLSV